MIGEVIEALVRYAQSNLTKESAAADDKTLAISCAALFRDWAPGAYKTGDIRKDPATGCPKECMTDHDSTVNTDWTIDVGTIWKAYHSQSKGYALPFEAPTGSHDIYRSGEYMIYTDDKVYKCLEDTSYSPADHPQAWELAE